MSASDANPTPDTVARIHSATAALGPGPLTEEGVRTHVFPLFSRVLERNARTGQVYLANHSLGRPLDALEDDCREALAYWYRDLDGAWDAWMAESDAHRARIARLIGCARPDAVVPKTSAGQGLRAVLNALPAQAPAIVTTRGEFDSIDTVLKTYEHKGRARVTRVASDDAGLFHAEQIAAAITPETDLVVVSPVCFVTGQAIEHLDLVIDAARAHGALVVLDSYHAAGVMPLDFDDSGADFMIGGNYKYTRGGPGACWLAVHPRHLRGPGTPDRGDLFTLDTGWFAKEAPFSYARADEPRLAEGGDAWLESTPPVLTYYQARSGLEFVLALGVERLRAYSLEQQQRLIELLRERRVEPRVIEPRGAYLLIETADGPGACAALLERGVVADARPCPTGARWYVRLCPDVLTTDDELAQAARVAGDLIA